MAHSGGIGFHASSDREMFSGVARLFSLFSNTITVKIVYRLHRKAKTLSEISRLLQVPLEDVRTEIEALLGNGILISLAGPGKTRYRLAEYSVLQSLDLIKRIMHGKIERERHSIAPAEDSHGIGMKLSEPESVRSGPQHKRSHTPS